MSLQEQIEELKKELLEAQKIRVNHWNKYQLSSITENILREFITKNIDEELNSVNTVSFILKCVLRYNSKNKLKAEEMLFLVSNVCLEFFQKKYKLNNEDDVVALIVDKITKNKLNQLVLIKILKNNLIKSRQKKHDKVIKKFKDFMNAEYEKILEKQRFIENIGTHAYKIFVNQKKTQLVKSKVGEGAKKTFVLKPSKKIKVAVVLDEFSYECFKNEFEAIVVTPQDWKEKFEKEQPDLFFCESAWSGVDSVLRPWKGKVYTSTNWKKENRNELLEILDFCKKTEIPTVFWNKEDPSHYDDRKHDFVKTAVLFDHIFTTAEECVELYKREYGVKNVHVLPFATSPIMFNPIENKERNNSIVFAGSWYANHEQRTKDMEKILDALLETHSLKIVDRYYGTEDELHKYPEKFGKYIYPSVSFKLIPDLYKESNIALNFNTVKESKTMFARRVFELMSSNTLVLTNTSEGMENLLSGLFIDVEKNPHVLKKVSIEDIDAIREKALDYVLKNHTYRHRWNYILEKINYETINDEHSLTIVTVVDSESDIDRLLERFSFVRSCNVKLLIILSAQFQDLEVEKYITKYSRNNIGVTALSFIRNYGVSGSFIETTHFFLMDKNIQNIDDVVGKLIAHSYYFGDACVTFDNLNKYKYKKGFWVKNVFTVNRNFKLIVESLNQYIEQEAYCLNEIIEVV